MGPHEGHCPSRGRKRRCSMPRISTYYLPGLAVEDCSIEVPLDWGDPEGSEKLSLFYRVVCAPKNVGRDLPLLVYLQGGPGGEAPRVSTLATERWLADAVEHFRVVLPDQRGCGRSSRVDGALIEAVGAAATARGQDAARAQADYLKRFLADSIVDDFDYLRRVAFGGRTWVTLGQSYGGFLTLCYLSRHPEGVAAAFVGGGIPYIFGSAADVYAHTFVRMAAKTRDYYRLYPDDEKRVALVADCLAAGDVRLPDGSPFTVERLQAAGSRLGMKPYAEDLHNLFDLAFIDGDGSCEAALAAVGGDPSRVRLHAGFLEKALALTSSANRPLYWTLQELIYANGHGCAPAGWAAAHEAARRPEFLADARPLMFFGEAAFPWMFEEDPALAPFFAAEKLLMEDTDFGDVYDADALAANEVPLYAAVYFDDAYVDSGLQLETLGRVGSSHAWVTNEFQHDGLHEGPVFKHLFDEALDRGDLESVFGR